jgi:hypothetical protein
MREGIRAGGQSAAFGAELCLYRQEGLSTTMRLAPFSLLVCAIFAGTATVRSFSQTPGVPVGQGHYTIVQANDGKTVGSADCTVGSLAAGYQIDSRGELKLAKFSYTFANSNRVDERLNVVRDQLTGTVNGTAVTFNLESDATGRQFNVNITAAGKNTTNTLDRHQHTVLLPDLDPAAYVEMAHFALERPATSWIVIPKQEGLLVPSDYEGRADAHGTLQGQSVLVHHTSVIVSAQNGITVEIYYTNDGSLLEADLPEQNFYVIHDGFKLENRPQYAPPRGSGGPPPQGAAPQGQSPQSPLPSLPGAPEYTVPPGQTAPQVQPQQF